MKLTIQELDIAFRWLCNQRQHYPDNADVWNFRRAYPVIKTELLGQVNRGDYLFSVPQKIVKSDGSVIHLWSSPDALVMKLLSDHLQGFIQPSKRCTHVKGHGV